jgi:hypothetical protein
MLRTLAPDELVTSESLLELHRCLTLDSGTSSGEFRSGLAVGSHMFYKFYRVFAPADEVNRYNYDHVGINRNTGPGIDSCIREGAMFDGRKNAPSYARLFCICCHCVLYSSI